ncbi:hypothetical protein [Sinosporangium siamense]|uniref:hypothetical protein n=1 Tax=Sinosporangium siamense TaxID=1367973 RepID=UPI0019529A29|nr:hypothetical protein [Sinosporangium siamense]
MSNAEQIAQIFRIALEVLREAGLPLGPDRVRAAVSRQVDISAELQAPDRHGQARWWAQLGFRTGEAAAIGWMSKRNGWSLTDAGVRALADFPGSHLYRELVRQYRARRTPLSTPTGEPSPFEQFQQNLEYARQLVRGGQNLERLKVGAFDVSDLYRAAWTQSVAALDHWITRELIDRAVLLAINPQVPRPPKFDKLPIPVGLFERIHHGRESLEEVFRAHLDQVFGFMTFQNLEKIKEGLAHVSTVKLWVKVAEILTDQDPTAPVTQDKVRRRLEEIAWRRNNIAHTADHDPEHPGQKMPITSRDAEETLSWLESTAIAIQLALGDPLPAEDYSAVPSGAGALGEVPQVASRSPLTRGNGKQESFLHALETYTHPEVSTTLLAVYRHAESHPAFRGYRHYCGEAAHPSATAWFSLGSDEAAVWGIYTGVSKSVLTINFEWMRNRGADRGRLARVNEALAGLPGWTDVSERLAAADYGKRPSIGPVALSHPDAARTVISALDELLK